MPSVNINPTQQAMVKVALARLNIALVVLEHSPTGDATASGRAIGQIRQAIADLQANLPFTTKG